MVRKNISQAGRYQSLLNWKETKGLIISFCWYVSKDHHFILLPGHILYRKPSGSQDSLYRGQIQKLLQCCREPYQHISSCYNDSEKNIIWSIYDVPFRSYWRKVKGKICGSTGVKQVKMIQFCWQWSKNVHLMNNEKSE